MSLIHYNFESQYLNNNTDVNIILPDKPRDKTPEQFYGSGKKYKVLWLLHGTFGDYTDWIRKSNIELYACERDLIVVMPSALNADYVNWPDFALGYNTWDYLFEELMPLVHHWLPASDKREDNFIAGLSMGGNGTLQYAAGHPEKFGGAAILSCAPRDLHQLAKDLEDPEFAKVNYRLVNGIRNAGGMEGYLSSPINVWDRLPELIEQDALPPLYFCCGKKRLPLRPVPGLQGVRPEVGAEGHLRGVRRLYPRMAVLGPDHPEGPHLLRAGPGGGPGQPVLREKGAGKENRKKFTFSS